MYEDEDNDGKFPDESPVEISYPRSKQEVQTFIREIRGARSIPVATGGATSMFPPTCRRTRVARRRAPAGQRRDRSHP